MPTEVDRVTKMFKCDVCHEPFNALDAAERCEERHAQLALRATCEHEFEYSAEEVHGDYHFWIYRICKKCGMETECTAEISDIPEEILAKLFQEDK